jgi:hypothetical protein
MAKKKTERLFTVGPGTQFIFHRKDRRNYWWGQTFALDHLTEAETKNLIDKGAVVDVTGKTDEEIAAIVAGYNPFTVAQVKAAMQSINDGNEE